MRKFLMSDPHYSENALKIIKEEVQKIYNNNSTRSFHELYTSAYHMVLLKDGEKLYCGIMTTLAAEIREILALIESAGDENFLEELNRKWMHHKVALGFVHDILLYMDRNFIKTTQGTITIHEIGYSRWIDFVIGSKGIRDKLPNTLVNLVLRERRGEVISTGLTGNITKMLMDLGMPVYEKNFKKPFLADFEVFYGSESRELINSGDCRDYLMEAERRINEEWERVSDYLDPSCESKIIRVVVKQMIENHMQTLVHMENSGLVNMLMGDKYEDLERMYNLFSRTPSGLTVVKDVMTSFIRDTGKQLIMDPERLKDPVDLVQHLLDLKEKYDKAITLAFNNDMKFQNALNSAFEYFINLNARSPEFISLFVDDKLRRGLKGVGEEDVEIVLDKVMRLFRYLQEKDVFEKYHKQHLAKRLLSGKNVSDEAERSLIVKLKTECGYQFTSKLEGMLTDMNTSYDMMQGFLACHGAELGDSPTLSVQVLTTDSWPIQSSPQCNLPSEVLGAYEKFRNYYLGKHIGRSLSLKTNTGTADLMATFGMGRKHELNVSTYQMSILMLFNNDDWLSCKEIEQATAIPMSDLKRCLQSLALVKGKNVLRKEPMSKDIAEDDAFFFNDEFTNKLFKVRIGTVAAQRESEQESVETRKRVEEDRKPQIEAAIVRVMKTRKILEYNNIIAEVTKQLLAQFLPNPAAIKKGIESLIEREFLERYTDRNTYRYLA
ncbi:cullin-3A-like [Trifolium pratense]|uniref:cullin-3A-like n=1 Tax=Trifolium pratense TaxID=57577 RepID=UPI001E691F7F|nr:cullin-3A-like [Trifolium pratense]